ncbi:MAG: hypothetical protein JSS14_21785 [Proteobacteria bacterium]|nr:hypothetical protein [Pseudomonadota bacterium]
MSDLRSDFDVAAPLDVTPITDAATAEGMGSLRRGFQVGRLASDANAWAADEAALRAAGDVAGADALRAQITANQQRQAAFAPRVGRVEDVHGVGDALDWAGGQVGQGTASMVEPVGAATALGAVGRLGRMAPGAAGKALGLAGDIAAPLAAFGINQRQLKGEFVNDAVNDKALMARTSPQDLNRTAELYGAGAGLLDTALPAVVGRQLTGAGLRKGLHSLSPLPRVGLEMLGEGGTELAQTAGSHAVQGMLNPERDTSGDFSENLNAFAGGAAGGGPFAAAGVAADTGFRRVGHTADQLGAKAGEVFDLAKDAVAPSVEQAAAKGRGWIGALKNKAGETIDLARDEDGKLDLGKAFDQVQTAAGEAVNRFNVSREEQAILNQDVPENVLGDDAALAAWVQNNDGKRNQLVADRLADMAETDQTAAQLLQRITEPADVTDQQAAIDEGAAHVLQNNELERLVTRAERAASVAGEVAGKAGTALGKGAKAAGGVAVKFGKAIFEGAKAGAKKNEQSNESMEEFDARMNQAASIAENAAAQRLQGTRFQRAPVPELVRQTALKIATVAPKFKAKSLTTGQEMQLGQMAEDLRVGLGDQAPQVLAEMKAVAPKETHKLFDYIAEQTAAANTPAGRRAREEMRRDVANQLVTMLPREHQSVLMASDGAGAPMNRQWLLDTVERVADGQGTLHQRQLLQEMFGKNFDRVLEAVNGLVQEKVEAGRTVDDRGIEETSAVNDEGETVEGVDDFEKRQAEKTSAKNTGPKVYGFARTPTLRGSNERRDPFSPLERMSDKQRLEFENENRQREAEGLEPLAGTPVKRPALFKKDDVLHSGENAINKKVADMERAMGVSEDNGSYVVSAKSAREVMKDLGYGNAKALSLYRDYLRQDAEKAPMAERRAAREQVNQVNKAVLDAMDQGKGQQYRLTPKERRQILKDAQAYFDERFVVTAEQLSDRDPSQISRTELMDLGRQGDRAFAPPKPDPSLSEAENEAAYYKQLDEKNILTFKSDVMARPGGKNRDLHISANSLVGWVKKQRGENDTGGSARTKNERYLSDLAEGIALVMASGAVDGELPSKMNAQGQAESFKDGIPPSLRLATSSFAEFDNLRGQRATVAAAESRLKKLAGHQEKGGDARESEGHQEAVANEQDKDFFTPDDSPPDERKPRLQLDSALTRAEKVQLQGMNRKEARSFLEGIAAKIEDPDERQAFLTDLALNNINGALFNLNERGTGADEKGVTPLDSFGKTDPNATLTGAPDEFADQQFRTRNASRAQPNREANAPVKKGNFVGSAKREREAKAAPEVAAKESPKSATSQSKPAGAADWSGKGRKLNAQANEIHADLGKPGFAATHDSPIKHEGKFNWREHRGKGEGVEAYGAGTYLSTGDVTHKFYKSMFAAQTEQDPDQLLMDGDLPLTESTSPTYQVSVDIPRDELLDWNKPLSEQSAHVQNVLSDEPITSALKGREEMTGKEIYQALTKEFGDDKAETSNYLQAIGLPGLTYAASNGRDGGKTPNYVIFDDSKIHTNYVHFNQQDARDGNSAVASQKDMDDAKAYVEKVLGPKIKVDFEKLTGHSGEWLDHENVIKISTTAAAGTLSTAYHEALHAFFSRYVKGEPRVLEVMKSLAENQKILERVHALLDGFPKAQEQLKDGEERLAYIYQFWAAGALDLPTSKGRTWLQKLGKFFRRVLGTVSDSERATELFEAFHAGQLAEPSAAGQVIAKTLAQGTMTLRARRKLDGLLQAAAAATLPANEILLGSKSERARMLGREFYANPGEEAAGRTGEGYLNARSREARKYKNLFADAIEGLSDRDLKTVSAYLQSAVGPEAIPYAPHAKAVKGIRASLDRFYDYMKESGLDVGYIEKYFPVMWSSQRLIEQKQAFVDMLTTNYADVLQRGADTSSVKGMSQADVAERIWAALVQNQGANKIAPDREDGVLVPFFESGEGRTLDWIKPEHREPFLEKDLVGQMSRYFHQGARAAEYAKRFGQKGEQLNSALEQIDDELWTEGRAMVKRGELDRKAMEKWQARQMRDVRHAVGAMEGTLGKDISPTLRKFNSYMTVYQNVRLLPLSLFSSFVDPLALIARGGEMKDAYNAFLDGMKEVFRAWGNAFRDEPAERKKSEWEQLAEFVGAIDSEVFSHHISEEYSSEYMTPLAKRINDKMFVLNGMEAWNRSMRVAATKAATEFITKHKSLPTEHSKRWLSELGLSPQDITLDADGRLVTDRHVLAKQKGVSLEQATEDVRAIHYAINRWVEGAVLTPNAAQRPSWSSDPRYSVLFHLKQFTYSFHQTVLKRAVKELEYGNLAPMGVFAWYIPTMIAADVTKGLLQGGGSLPAYMKGYDLGDWVMHGAQRAGLLGVGQLGVDANADISSLAGPAVEQAIDALRDPLADSTIRALPLHGLYREALR